MKYITSILLSVTFFSCIEEESLVVSDNFSDEEAAEVVAQSLTTELNGLTENMDPLVVQAKSGRAMNTFLQPCGTSYDTIISGAYENDFYSSNYTAHYSYQLTCEKLIPTSLIFDYLLNVDGGNAKSETKTESKGSFIITGLVNSESYNIKGLASSAGTMNLIIANQSEQLISSSTLTLAELTVNKQSSLIASGTGTYQFSGTTKGGRSVSIEAVIVFQGNLMATININEVSFQLDLTSGLLTKAA